MIELDLKRSQTSDETDLLNFYTLVISHTFKVNGIDDDEGIKEEVEHQMKNFHDPEDIIFVARHKGEIKGTIALGKQNRSVKKNISKLLWHLPEVKGVYVHPLVQGQGIGNYLWKSMITYMWKNHIHRACLDSGYKTSQKFWTQKLGDPQIMLKDYWGKDEHQWIWFFSVGSQYKHLL